MYLNFKELHKLEWTPTQLMFVLAVKQKEEEYSTLYYDEEFAEEMISKRVFKRLKKGELRIDTQGNKVLKKLSSSGEISPETEVLVDWLLKIYKANKGGVKNKKETQRRCEWFSEQTGFTGNKLAILLKCFVQDVYNPESGLSVYEAKKQNPRLQLSVLVDNIFWTPPNNFARHYNLDNSPLWIYFEENLNYVEQEWKKQNVE